MTLQDYGFWALDVCRGYSVPVFQSLRMVGYRYITSSLPGESSAAFGIYWCRDSRLAARPRDTEPTTSMDETGPNQEEAFGGIESQ